MILIRSFTPSDTGAVHQIGANTAYYGDPVEHIMNDRVLFIDFFLRPYTSHYPDSCWVAELDGAVVGYLTGCLDTAAHQAIYCRTLLRVTLRMFAGRYRLGWRTLRTGIGFLRDLFARHPSPDLTCYPAHLHINLTTACRGQGIGRQLILMYLEHCRGNSIQGVHLSTSERNTVGLHLYRALGFSLLHCYRSHYHSTISRQPVNALIMGLKLAPSTY